MRPQTLAALVVTATLSVPAAAVTLAPSASATPCDQSSHTTAYKKDVVVRSSVNGNDSDYNRTADPYSIALSFGKSTTFEVSKHWEIGGTVGGGFGPVKAEITTTYGEDYTDSETTSTSATRTMTIRPGWTGWVRAVVYQHVIYWDRYTYRWNPSTKRCDKRILDRAYWGAPKIQYVPITKKGRVFPE